MISADLKISETTFDVIIIGAGIKKVADPGSDIQRSAPWAMDDACGHDWLRHSQTNSLRYMVPLLLRSEMKPQSGANQDWWAKCGHRRFANLVPLIEKILRRKENIETPRDLA